MKPLSGVDAAFLHLETPETPMHVGSVSLFELPARYRRDFHAEVKRQMARRLHLAPVLHRKLAPMPLQFANPVWVDDDAVDLDHHVQRVTLPPPGTTTQFDDCIGRLHAELLDRSRPLWRLHVIDGLQSGQVGYYFKAHHAALDGQAGILLARTLFDLSPRPPALPRAKHGMAAEHPGWVELGATALRHDAGEYVEFVRHLPDVVRTLAGLLGPVKAGGAPGRLRQNFAFGPPTPLNGPITAERGFAALSLPLDGLGSLATAHDAKLDDIVLAWRQRCAAPVPGGHRRHPEKPLTAAMPISLRDADAEYTTRATMPLVNLHTHIPTRYGVASIRDAADAVRRCPAGARAWSNGLPLDRRALAAATTWPSSWPVVHLAAVYRCWPTS